MVTKTTKKTSEKSEKNTTKKSTKKVVVKRRTSDLTPTRASAVAIASQANRAQKQALIEKLSAEEKVTKPTEKSTKIPLWVWMFFWCSLLLFCISFYKAIIYPQLEKESNIIETDTNIYRTNGQTIDDAQWQGSASLWDDLFVWDDVEDVVIENPKTAPDVIKLFFTRLSDRDFDGSFALLVPALQKSSEMRNHFTSFRMNPFLSWIEWEKLEPTNFQYVSTSAYGRDRYSFSISYTLTDTQDVYDETWEAVVDTTWDNPKITSITCTTSKCSYHPIFWPENFGLMR